MSKVIKFHQDRKTYYIDLSNILSVTEFDIPSLADKSTGERGTVGEILHGDGGYLWIEEKETLDNIIRLYCGL